jgi:hypothetical protein
VLDIRIKVTEKKMRMLQLFFSCSFNPHLGNTSICTSDPHISELENHVVFMYREHKVLKKHGPLSLSLKL